MPVAARAPHISPVEGGLIKDADWISNIFLLPKDHLVYSDTIDFSRWRTYTTAKEKFVDTTLGGNYAINCPPQYTRYADLKISGINMAHQQDGAEGRTRGMGWFYSEQMDDNQQLIHLSFGQAKYNGLVTFFTGFYDTDAALVAREGRGLDVAFRLGKILGLIVSIPLLAISALGNLWRFFFKRPSSKYYYFSQAMPLYWNRVQYIVDTLGVYMGLVPRIVGSSGSQVEDDAGIADDVYRQFAHKAAPDIFDSDGSVIMYNVANKAARLSLLRRDAIRARFENENLSQEAFLTNLQTFSDEFKITDPGPPVDFRQYIKTWFDSTLGSPSYAVDKPNPNILADVSTINPNAQLADGATKTPEELAAETGTQNAEKLKAANNTPNVRAKIIGIDDGKVTHAELANQYQNAVPGEQLNANPSPETIVPNAGPTPTADGGIVNSVLEGLSSAVKYLGGLGSEAATTIEANAKGGANYVTFAVEFQSSASDSFSNQVKDSEIMSKINGISSTNASLRFRTADGQSGFDALDIVTKAARDVVAGFAEGVSLGGLIALSGTAFTDIPKHYDSSSANFGGSLTFNIPLRAWAGHALCRFTQLIIPYAMLLAGGLPISTGKQSFTGPFLCQLYSPGRFTGRLCMITGIEVTRGAGNMGWNNNGDMLGMDISLTITSLDNYLHAPIDTGMGLFKFGKPVMDDDNPFNDYMAALANLSIADQTDTTRKLQIAMTRKLQEIDSFYSVPRFANFIDGFPPAQFLGRVTNLINGYSPNQRLL